jgi:hypothetical protein
VDTIVENQLIRTLLTGPAWLGGNARSNPAVWRWSHNGVDDGEQFWSGGAQGTTVNGRFAFFDLGRPGSAACLAIQATDGRWFDSDCTQPLPYVCEYERPPRFVVDIPPNIPRQPPISDAGCIPEDAGVGGLPGDLDTLRQQVELVEAGEFHGAAADPPAEGTSCPDDPYANNCLLTNVQPGECFGPSDCTQYGPEFVCRLQKDDPTCVPGPGTMCRAHAHCGVLACEPDPFPTRCQQMELCPAPSTEFDAGFDPGTNLGAGVFNPSGIFGTPPDTTPSTSYSDPPSGSGRNHRWCSLNPLDTGKVQEVHQPAQLKHGETGGGSPIRLSFDPDLVFDANANPLAFGESNMHLHAAASLSAHADLSFFGESFSAEIIRAGIGIVVDRCHISTGESVFEIFGETIDGVIPKLDSADTGASGPAFAASELCQSNLGKYIIAADRVKKAYRDAQQLLSQYYALKTNGLRFGADLCEQLGISDALLPNFPGGSACALGESPEFVINRFIDYYQSDNGSEVGMLREVARGLAEASAAFRSAISSHIGAGASATLVRIPFIDITRQESQNILRVPFFIGPVPMTFEIDAVESYGVRGAFDVTLDLPTDLGPNRGNLDNTRAPIPQNIAHARAAVEPHASAGLSLFLGAGFSVPGVSASVGVEGGINMATIQAPAAAGVGLGIAAVPDTRQLPSEVMPPVAAAPLGGTPTYPIAPPTSYQFFVTYDYGASVNFTDILAGAVNARLRIKFFFFSRTWRKQILKFNGFSKSFDLLGDQGTIQSFTIPGAGSTVRAAMGAVAMGLSEAELPLVLLAKLPPPTIPMDDDAGVPIVEPYDAGAANVAPLDKTAVGGFFYDDLCCSKQNEPCADAGRPMCCPGFQCTASGCQPAPVACIPNSEPCGPYAERNANCCSGQCNPETNRCNTIIN